MKHILITAFAMIMALTGVHAQEHERQISLSCDTLYRYVCDCGCHNHPVNNYSGLNSLRERLANRSWDGSSDRSSTWGLSLNGSSANGIDYGNNDSDSYGNIENESLPMVPVITCRMMDVGSAGMMLMRSRWSTFQEW